MRCPVCRAENDQGPQCRRCRADLSLLFMLERQRERVLAQAHVCLRQGEYQQALALVEGADTLRRDVDSQRLRTILHVLRGDYRRALACYPVSTTSRGAN